jgi:tetraacyldisaccharide 4'-kinase
MRTPNHWQNNNVLSRLLMPFGWIYFQLSLWRHKIARSVDIGVPVICVGNIVAGGAGKTPTVMYLGKLLSKRLKVAFLTRGYGGAFSGPIKVSPHKHTFQDVGDEALLLSKIAPTWVSKNRLDGGLAAKLDGAQIILMDDGFQNPTIGKTFSILVFDGPYGVGNNQLIPSGPLRETLGHGMSRADAVVIIGEDLHDLQSKIPENIPLFSVTTSPIISKKLRVAKSVIGFAGIGRPRKFLETLKTLNVEIQDFVPFPDHHKFRNSEIEDLIRRASETGAQLVTTTKDFVRLPPNTKNSIIAMDIELNWANQNQIKALLEQVLDNPNA